MGVRMANVPPLINLFGSNKKWLYFRPTTTAMTVPNQEFIEIPPLTFDEKGDLLIRASPTSSEKDFDFYVGTWQLHNRQLKERLNNCMEWTTFDATIKMYKVLNGLGNIDHLYTTLNGTAFEGMSIRFFNPDTKLWSIHWADTHTLKLDKPTVGCFDGDFGHFFTLEQFNGKKIAVVYRWDVRDKNSPVWSQAFSADNGQNWEWNWYMYFTRVNE
jgi:hypothetical protein